MRQSVILEEHRQTVVSGQNDVGPSDKYKKLIFKLVSILCAKKYRKIAINYVSRDYFPIDECLEICEREDVADACAILYKRKGKYKKSISLYVEVLTELSQDVIIAVSVVENIKAFNDPESKNESIKRFDELLTMIIDICDNYGSKYLKEEEAQDLWLYSIEQIYKIKKKIVDDNTNPAEQEDLENFKVFLLARIQEFMMRMAEYVSLDKIINLLQQKGQ